LTSYYLKTAAYLCQEVCGFQRGSKHHLLSSSDVNPHQMDC
jgi:hypothetical protein